MTLPAPGAVRVLRYVVVDDPHDPAAPGGALAALLAAGWTWEPRAVVFPASGRAEIATVLVYMDEAEGAE